MRAFKRKNTKPFSIFTVVSLCLFLVTVIIVEIAKASPAFADYFNDTVAHFFRFIMARLGGLFPFSIYEVIMLSIPFFVSLIVFLAIRKFKSGEGRLRFCFNIVSVVLLFIAGHNIALGVAYNTTTVEKKMELSEVEVTEERLAEILCSLRDEINILSEEINYTEDGVSVPNLTFRQISDLLVESYGKLNEKYGFPKNFYSYAKRVHFGNLMSYLGITGIYTYYTGDANVNSAYPPYDITFTTAHELAHQRGILRENEANFMAYLVTSSSDNPFLRYSGALNMYLYIGSALRRTNNELYQEISSSLCDKAKSDINASYSVTRKYGDTIIADISNLVNDLFLKSNGTAGVVTYGRVVTLTVMYYESVKTEVK